MGWMRSARSGKPGRCSPWSTGAAKLEHELCRKPFAGGRRVPRALTATDCCSLAASCSGEAGNKPPATGLHPAPAAKEPSENWLPPAAHAWTCGREAGWIPQHRTSSCSPRGLLQSPGEPGPILAGWGRHPWGWCCWVILAHPGLLRARPWHVISLLGAVPKPGDN